MKRIFKEILKELSEIEDVKAIILYGGFARGEYTSRSDVDLFILTAGKGTQQEIQDKIIALESEIDRDIQPTIRTTDELKKTDTGLLQNIFQEGKVLYLKESIEIPSAALLWQKPYIIYSFQITSSAQKDKARFNRGLYAQKIGSYEYTGLLQEMGGQKLSAGCVMIPFAKKQVIEKFFKKFNVKFEQLKVWK